MKSSKKFILSDFNRIFFGSCSGLLLPMFGKSRSRPEADQKQTWREIVSKFQFSLIVPGFYSLYFYPFKVSFLNPVCAFLLFCSDLSSRFLRTIFDIYRTWYEESTRKRKIRYSPNPYLTGLSFAFIGVFTNKIYY